MKILNGLTLLLICLLMCFAACRAPEQLRDKAKAQRYVRKIEQLDPSALKSTTDTIYSTYIFTDTVYIESVYKDTLFTYLPGDTIYLYDNESYARVIFMPNNSASLSLNIPSQSLVLLDSASIPTAISTNITVDSKPIYTWLLSLWRKFWWLIMIAAILTATWFIIKHI